MFPLFFFFWIIRSQHGTLVKAAHKDRSHGDKQKSWGIITPQHAVKGRIWVQAVSEGVVSEYLAPLRTATFELVLAVTFVIYVNAYSCEGYSERKKNRRGGKKRQECNI